MGARRSQFGSTVSRMFPLALRAIADARKVASLAIGPRRNSDHPPEGRSEVRRVFISAQCSYGGDRLISPTQKPLGFFHAKTRQVLERGLSVRLLIQAN